MTSTTTEGIRPKLLLTPEDIERDVQRHRSEDAFVVDVETTSLQALTNSVLWVGLASGAGVSLIPLGFPNGDIDVPEHFEKVPIPGTERPWKNNPNRMTKPKTKKVRVPPTFLPPPEQVRPDVGFDLLKPLFYGDQIKIGHNLTFDLISIAKYYGGALPPGPYVDTMVLSHLVDEDRTDYKLKRLITKWLLPRATKEQKKAFYEDLGAKILDSSLYDVGRYLAKDVRYTWLYYKELLKHVEREGLMDVLRAEGEVFEVLMAMTYRGVAIDHARADDVLAGIRGEISDIEARAWKITGEPFKLTNNNEKRRLLFDPKDWGGQGLKPLSYTKKTKEPQANQATVEHYAPTNDLAAAFLEHSVVDKRRQFVEGLVDPENLINGRIHTSYNLHRADTGRLSSSAPNLQNVPRDNDDLKMREMFIPSPGMQFIVADYDQVELRVIAHLTRDPEMTRLFTEGHDIHREAAAAMLGIAEEEVTSEQRTKYGKTVNFGVAYGAQANRVAGDLGVTKDTAQDFLDRYYARFANIQPWKTKQLRIAVESGDKGDLRRFPPYVEIPPYGRRRRIPDLYSDNKWDRYRAQRQAINAIIQGFASYIMKIAMVNLHPKLEAYGAHLVLQVHDEITVEAPVENIEIVQLLIEDTMSGVMIDGQPALGSIPLVVSAHIGDSWSEGKG